jgi:hypothetical protein
MKAVLVALCLGFATTVASAADRASKIQALMEAQGLLQMFDQQMAMGRQQGRQQAQKMLDQVISSLEMPPKFDARFRDAFDEYMKALESPWAPQDLVNVWADKYGRNFTDAELDQLVAYYTSPLGRKDVAASQAALPQFSDHFSELSKPIMEKATQTYVQRLQATVKDCKCSRK